MLSAADIIALCGLALVVFGGATVWAVRINKGESASASAKNAHERIDKLSGDLADFKTTVAKEYVPNSALTHLEARVDDGFKSIRDQLNRLFEPRSSRSPSRRSRTTPGD